MRDTALNKILIILIVVALAGGAGWYLWTTKYASQLPDNVASGNGRIEATEYDIATKYAGRVETVLVQEGDMVEAGQVLATMDTVDLQAQLREAEAGLREARESREYAAAIVLQRESELSFAQAELNRSLKLIDQGHVSQETVDQQRTALRSAQAALKAAKIQVVQAEAGIEAAEARIERLQGNIADSQLTTPISGRVLYRLAEPGEVLAAGGKVLSVLDLTDVYMTIFLPTAEVGNLDVGSEARIILDAIPQYTIPARISFVAPRAQFTPKAVETRSEREKLMFRVKVKIDSKLLKQHVEKVKTGLPGMAYVLLKSDAEWPAELQVRLP
ncbi:HlyD family secretion protein [Sedimenticola thiotaurini]|uniref:Hemolysin secretion protein D n=1 Tax=Sedimenticola thiotaurini TaxID=1543721 RepID=A0A0F7JZS6_9GAMM|nr:efflux RND transporter periplasmic adaptor subunit [Sedimenticola thiotaurini]AKH21846.1 hemolysin secretion protein D [Sedimenticola thiotaurini]